jgi:hypothetical protein
MNFDVITLYFALLAAPSVVFGIIQLTRCGGRYGKRDDH